MDRLPSSSEPASASLRVAFRDRRGEMPREKLALLGPQALSDAELLAIFLRCGRPGVNVLQLAGRILDIYEGDLRRLSMESPGELEKIPGVGPVHGAELVAMFEFARRAVLRPRETRPRLDTARAVARYLAGRTALETVEKFFVLPLDRKMRLCGRVQTGRLAVSTGTADSTAVHPRDVFREAVRSDACGVVVAHNHPSGDCRPSAQDLRLTYALAEAGSVLRIPLVDHVIIGAFPPGADLSDPSAAPSFHSMRDSGDVDFK
ncbi:MAG: DNA repair protein RadC [Kiritimatiellae bacterium]|nr:DNA repair protein RadC [Kiritimatiellia bacterium]